MDDIFYFSERELSLEEVAALVREHHFEFDYQVEDGFKVRVGKGHWEYCVWDTFALDHADPDVSAELRSGGIRSAFCISHHPDAIEAILPLLKEVLREFGGWIGNDTDDFRPRFDASTIAGFRYGDGNDA